MMFFLKKKKVKIAVYTVGHFYTAWCRWVLSDELAGNELFRYLQCVEGIYAADKAVGASRGLCTTNGNFKTL